MSNSNTENQSNGIARLISLVSPEEVTWLAEERKQEAQRLKERLSQIPFYAQRAAKDPDYWEKLAISYKTTSPSLIVK